MVTDEGAKKKPEKRREEKRQRHISGINTLINHRGGKTLSDKCLLYAIVSPPCLPPQVARGSGCVLARVSARDDGDDPGYERLR